MADAKLYKVCSRWGKDDDEMEALFGGETAYDDFLEATCDVCALQYDCDSPSVGLRALIASHREMERLLREMVMHATDAGGPDFWRAYQEARAFLGGDDEQGK